MSDDLVKRLRHPVGGMRPTISDGRAAADRIEELEAKLAKAVSRLDKLPYWLEEKLAKAVSRLDKLTYWLDIDQELWDAFTVMEKSDHRHMQSEVQAIKDILTGGKDD